MQQIIYRRNQRMFLIDARITNPGSLSVLTYSPITSSVYDQSTDRTCKWFVVLDIPTYRTGRKTRLLNTARSRPSDNLISCLFFLPRFLFLRTEFFVFFIRLPFLGRFCFDWFFRFLRNNILHSITPPKIPTPIAKRENNIALIAHQSNPSRRFPPPSTRLNLTKFTLKLLSLSNGLAIIKCRIITRITHVKNFLCRGSFCPISLSAFLFAPDLATAVGFLPHVVESDAFGCGPCSDFFGDKVQFRSVFSDTGFEAFDFVSGEDWIPERLWGE